MFSLDIPVLADILTAVYGPLLTIRAQSLTKDLRNHLTLYTLQPIPRPQNMHSPYLQPFPFKSSPFPISESPSLLTNYLVCCKSADQT